MKITFVILIVATLMVSYLSESTTIELPVKQVTLTKVNLSIKYLEEALKSFGTFLENRFLIYKRVELTKLYLQELKDELVQYNNVIVGTGNSVVGNKNIVIGNQNTFEGSNNWVLVSKYTGNINGDLVIGKWKIELEKSNLILINPRFAISFLNQARNQQFKMKFATNPREMCRWGKWTNPNNPKADQFWKNYHGYNEWKTNAWQPLFNLVGSLCGGLRKPTASLFGGLIKI